jgi:hypothetical protein
MHSSCSPADVTYFRQIDFDGELHTIGSFRDYYEDSPIISTSVAFCSYAGDGDFEQGTLP